VRNGFIGFVTSLAILLIAVLVPTLMFGCPKYTVYRQAKLGEAELRHAEFSRQVSIQDAHSKMEGSKMLAQAEIERAKGVAEANRIIGESLKNNDAYLRYLWVQSVGSGSHETIYVPTEGNLPILESGRLMKQHLQVEPAK
jgi:hypothetical protein